MTGYVVMFVVGYVFMFVMWLGLKDTIALSITKIW
jgi:hypothetical protein